MSGAQVISKNVVASDKGIVSTQHYLASQAGAKVLEKGGNAIDAAIATSFALGVVEPWMSGPGGGGFMAIKLKDTDSVQVINFGMHAPGKLDPQDYPLDEEGTPSDLFAWKPVISNRNIIGGGSVAVPGMVKGMDLAHQEFASKSWKSLLQPAIMLAKAGLQIDWYTQILISSAAEDLVKYPASRKIFMTPGGYPKSVLWASSQSKDVSQLDALTNFLEVLAEEGAQAFYAGSIAEHIVRAVQGDGGSLSMEDLFQYTAVLSDSLKISYRNCIVNAPPEMAAGNSLRVALDYLGEMQIDTETPGVKTYPAFARALFESYSNRLKNEGDQDAGSENSCTTHFSIVDKEGNMVAVTLTLLSIFGSKLMVPELGLLMNNGNMWFDPEQGKPNSLGPGKKCLSNMCPVIGITGEHEFAIGAAGGRRIFPAVFQLVSYMVDYKMTLEEAFLMPRIDVSGTEMVALDRRLPADVVNAVKSSYTTNVIPKLVYPHSFAIPSGVSRINQTNYGMTEITMPMAESMVERKE